jgi:hypothetical protein
MRASSARHDAALELGWVEPARREATWASDTGFAKTGDAGSWRS